jgi:hypothetical protein
MSDTLDIERAVTCPNPDFGGRQLVEDCQMCEFFGEVEYGGESMICKWSDEATS